MTKYFESAMKGMFFLSATSSIVFVLLICIFLFMNGLPVMVELGFLEFIFGTIWAPLNVPAAFGIFTMIVTSIATTIGAVILGVPLGIFTAVFMARMCPKRFYSFLKPSLNLMAGIPSVVYGFFGMVVLVPIIRGIFGGQGFSVLTASVLLGIMILPTIIGVSEAAIRSVPSSYYEGALALGASHIHSIFSVVVPAARSGIIASIVLGIGRAIGETMAVVMVAGNQVRIPNSPLQGARSLTANIVLEMAYAAGTHRDALVATALVLFLMILMLNLTLSLTMRRKRG